MIQISCCFIKMRLDKPGSEKNILHPTLFHKLILAGLPLAVLVGLYPSFLISALAWFIKITKIILFESSKVFHNHSFLALNFSLFSPMIFRLLCLLPPTALFTLTIWSFGHLSPWSPLQWRPHKELCFD